MFEFLTRELGLDPARLYVTVFAGDPKIGIPRDEETAALWTAQFSRVGIDAKDRIFFYDEKKNWWSRTGVPGAMPVGEPGGPDSEMFWDFGAHHGLHERSAFKDKPCHVNCDCGRFLEIGNNVFMQYKKTEQGFVPLPKANVDFGGGLERMAAALIDNPDVFRIDLFDRARLEIEKASGKSYGAANLDGTDAYAFRVMLDHLRAATFLIADGVLPSNKDQGYYVRRLIRRAIRFGHTLGVRGAFCASVAAAYIETYLGAYPSLIERRDQIGNELSRRRPGSKPLSRRA
jgi:alanyl-tRNA synthetase